MAIVFLLILAWTSCRDLFNTYLADATYSHGLAVPIIVAYLLYRDRGRFLAARPSGSWIGVAVTSLGAAMIVAGRWYYSAFLPPGAGYLTVCGLGLILASTGLLLGLHGWRRLRVAALPASLLLFAVPLPTGVNGLLTQPLRRAAAAAAEHMLRTCFVPVFREVNLLHLPNATLGVTDACSGIRSVWAMLAVAAALGLILRLGPARSILLIVSAPALAVAGNALRVFLTGMAAAYINPRLASGTFHETLGLVTVAIVGVGLIGLSRLLTPRARPQSGPRADTVQGNYARAVAPECVAACVMLAASALAMIVIVRHYEALYKPLREQWNAELAARSDFDEFPSTIAGFDVTDQQQFSELELSVLRADDYVARTYADRTGRTVHLTLLYWYPRLIGGHAHGRHGGPHPVEVCYRVSGWTDVNAFSKELKASWLPVDTFDVRLFMKSNRSRVLVYWQSTSPESDSLSSAYHERLHMLLRSWREPPAQVVQNRHSVAVAIDVWDSPELAQQAAFQFAQKVAQALPRFGIGTHGPDRGPELLPQDIPR